MLYMDRTTMSPAIAAVVCSGLGHSLNGGTSETLKTRRLTFQAHQSPTYVIS